MPSLIGSTNTRQKVKTFEKEGIIGGGDLVLDDERLYWERKAETGVLLRINSKVVKNIFKPTPAHMHVYTWMHAHTHVSRFVVWILCSTYVPNGK